MWTRLWVSIRFVAKGLRQRTPTKRWCPTSEFLFALSRRVFVNRIDSGRAGWRWSKFLFALSRRVFVNFPIAARV